ncbi:MAG: DUF1150 family protein [Minisyncoccia bacterium]
MSDFEFAHLGGGEVAYIVTLAPGKAKVMFPTLEEVPENIPLYSLHAADGTPLALTDTLQAAVGHAHEGDLAIVPLN